LAYGWDHLGFFNALTKNWSKVNLIEVWGPTGALLGTLAMLAVWFLLSSWWEKRFRYGTGIKQAETEQFAPKEA
jgi:uncharacterized membrane protein YedE/YeeE